MWTLQPTISIETYKELIKRLERPGSHRLAAEWEVAVLAALHNVSPLQHERPLSNGRKPDFRLRLGNPSLEIVGDIATVSDKGLHDGNPVQKFDREISRLARKYHLNPTHFGYQVNGRREGRHGDQRMKLLLPPLRDLDEFVRRRIEPFIRELAQNKQIKGSLVFEESAVDFTLTYDVSKMLGGGSYLTYDMALSFTKTPVYTALRKKADQLRGAPLGIPRIVILCDGGCRAMRHTRLVSEGCHSAVEIANNFLFTTTAVDMILLLTVERVNTHTLWDTRVETRADLVISPMGRRAPRFSSQTIEAIRSLLQASLEVFPRPVLDAHNAALRSNSPTNGRGFYGGYTMSGRTLRISSRQILELLAGAASFSEFEKSLGWDKASNPRGPRNPFATALTRGHMIRNVTVIESKDYDDDWLEFSFGNPDPAISPLRAERNDGEG